MSFFSVLSTGLRGLQASQMAMDINGQNISNADVEGYSKKRLNLSADFRFDSTYGQMGFGVEVVTIERLRNTFIDQQIQQQNREVGLYQEIDTVLETIENIFTEPGETGLQTFLTRFFDSWENLANNPSDSAARTMVKTNGEILTTMFHNLYTELGDLQRSRNDEIQNRIIKVNELSKEIFNLNREVASVEIGDQNANDSRDRRDVLLKELSTIIDVSVSENNVGQISVSTGGNILVSPVDTQEIEIAPYTTGGLQFKNAKKPYIPGGGQLLGLIQARDTVIPEYMHWLDTLALGLTTTVNDLHSRGFTLQGYAGINFFDPLCTGASDINLSASILSDIKNIAAAQGGQENNAGTNAIVAGTLDFGNAPVQLSKAGGPIPPFPTAGLIARNLVQNSVVVRTGTATLQENIDYHIDYVNGTIQMLHNGYDASAISVDFRYKTNDFPGPGNNANAIQIAQLRHNLVIGADALGNPNATFDQFYGMFIGKLGLSRNEASSNLTTREYLIQQYENHQDSISGVSLDEEMADLIKYQHTYQASARVISTVNEMLDILLRL